MRDVLAAVTCFFCISVCCFRWFIILCFHLIYPYMGTINCCFLVVVVGGGVVFSCKWNNGSLYPSLVCFCFTSVRKCIALESYRTCTFELDTDLEKERCRVYLWHVDLSSVVCNSVWGRYVKVSVLRSDTCPQNLFNLREGILYFETYRLISVQVTSLEVQGD
jgi:hypothetical protein